MLTFENFHLGAAPLAHLDSLTEEGASGHYSVASNIDIITTPKILTQGPGLSNLTNGTQAGAVTELMRHILEIPVTDDATYGISDTRLHKISATTVTNSGGVFPRTITGAQTGSSVIHFQGYLFYFYNKSSGADCGRYDLASTFDDDYMSTVPTGAAALQKAPHPVAIKQDIMLFGNGRYVGTFISTTTTLAPTKLDFGAGSEVADVEFHANQWWIAVNYGVSTGTNRRSGQIYLYDGGAINSILTDEAAVGLVQIGFIMPDNGVVYVAYRDLTMTNGYAIGYISGRQLIPLRYFTGSLPTFAQKTRYKKTVAFIADGQVWTIGAPVSSLPVQIAPHADAGYATVGALAAPFGTPLVASTDGGSNFRLAKFSGFDTACSWKSIVVSTMIGKLVGYIDEILVVTKTLGANARADLTIEANQASSTSTAKSITGTGKRRHILKNFDVKGLEDFRIALSWANGNTTNDCPIRKIQVRGHYKEKA